jgi:hypothetical protein
VCEGVCVVVVSPGGISHSPQQHICSDVLRNHVLHIHVHMHVHVHVPVAGAHAAIPWCQKGLKHYLYLYAFFLRVVGNVIDCLCEMVDVLSDCTGW